MDDTSKRVVAEAALAKRHGTRVNQLAGKASIPELVDEVEKLSTSSPIAFDEDGVPYLTIGE